MKRMTTTITLKQLRTDPRRLVDLLNGGYEIAITDHRRTLTTAHPGKKKLKPEPGDIGYILETIKNLPPLMHPSPYRDLEPREAIQRLRLEANEAKRQRIERQLQGDT